MKLWLQDNDIKMYSTQTAIFKSNFAKGYTPNWSQEVFWSKKLKTLCRGPVLLVISMAKQLLKCFTKKNCKSQIKSEFTVEKVIKRKVNKLYLK